MNDKQNWPVWQWNVRELEDRPKRPRGTRRRQRVTAQEARRYGRFVETRVTISSGDAAWLMAVNHN